MRYILLVFVLLFVGCQKVANHDDIHTQGFGEDDYRQGTGRQDTNKEPFGKIESQTPPIKEQAPQSSSKSKVLNIADGMIRKKVIYRGGCWDYINEVFNRALKTGGKKSVVFKSTARGPYANISRFLPGDWLYFINLSYRNIQHSSIFVRWIDYDKKIALMISYPGENRRKPGRYRKYKLSKVYNIIRYSDNQY